MKVISTWLITVALTTALCSCKHSQPLMETGDKELTVQVMKLANQPGEEGSQSYKARLIPEKKLMEGKGGEARTALWYKMDSCFYIQRGQAKIYASLVQPIANGVSGSYEYLLQFEAGKPFETDSASMVYSDRYINRKTYTLKLKD